MRESLDDKLTFLLLSSHFQMLEYLLRAKLRTDDENGSEDSFYILSGREVSYTNRNERTKDYKLPAKVLASRYEEEYGGSGGTYSVLMG
jgi:hypothetical protein